MRLLNVFSDPQLDWIQQPLAAMDTSPLFTPQSYGRTSTTRSHLQLMPVEYVEFSRRSSNNPWRVQNVPPYFGCPQRGSRLSTPFASFQTALRAINRDQKTSIEQRQFHINNFTTCLSPTEKTVFYYTLTGLVWVREKALTLRYGKVMWQFHTYSIFLTKRRNKKHERAYRL